jgi:hypothetical protein
VILDGLAAFVLARQDASELNLNPVFVAVDGARAVDAGIVTEIVSQRTDSGDVSGFLHPHFKSQTFDIS